MIVLAHPTHDEKKGRSLLPKSNQQSTSQMIKIVYFDEQSASDYLDITAGGKAVTTTEDVKKRAVDSQAKLETTLAARFSWLPFIGASGEAGVGLNMSREGQSMLSKTLSNTILTDYLGQVEGDARIARLSAVTVTAATNSLAFMKMYTPYMIASKESSDGIDLALLDEALSQAKGYYELVGEAKEGGRKCVLRFNIRAFRNNYGLTDLIRMDLTYHGIHVGRTTEASLGMEAEMSVQRTSTPLSPLDLVDGIDEHSAGVLKLPVYDVLLAGVALND